MKTGQRVQHSIYGLGTVIHVENIIRLGDNHTWPRIYQSSLTKCTNGWSRYDGGLNIAVRFDTGGPQGWAYNASNDIKDLKVNEEM